MTEQRDGAKDLAMLAELSPYPWELAPEKCGPDGMGVYTADMGPICEVGDPYPRGDNNPQENMEFIAQSPVIAEHWINRALAAEARHKKLEDWAKEKAHELCPDYPFRPDEDFYEHMWALTSTIEGTSLACDDLHGVIQALEGERDRLRDALEPFAAFADQWDRKPLGGLADEVYQIHAGSEYAAALRLSDCRRARKALNPLQEAGEE